MAVASCGPQQLSTLRDDVPLQPLFRDLLPYGGSTVPCGSESPRGAVFPAGRGEKGEGQVVLAEAKPRSAESHLSSLSTGQESVTGAHFVQGRLGNGSGSVPARSKSRCLMNP